MGIANPPKLKDIADNLGLSIGTVQRALHNKGGYSEETQAAVLEEAKRIGYSTNSAASSLRRAPITLDVILPEPVEYNHLFFDYLWQGIEQACNDLSNYQINIRRHYAERESDLFLEQMEQILNEKVACQGLITTAWQSERFQDLLSIYASRSIPVFIVNATSPFSTFKNIYSINANQCVGKLGGDIFSSIHQNSKGCVLVLGGSHQNELQVSRVSDFNQILDKKCPGLTLLQIHSYSNLPRLKTLIKSYLETLSDVKGIYAVSARETLIMCEVVSEMGFSRKLTLIGTDAFPELLPYFEDETLTATIFQYPSKQTYTAVHLLIADIIKSSQNLNTDHFPIVPVFKSNASIFCDPVGLI